MESFVKFPYYLPELWSLNCLKSAFFVLTSTKNIESIKTIYICASEKSRYALSENDIIVTHFQKMILLFIALWLTVSEILGFEEFC